MPNFTTEPAWNGTKFSDSLDHSFIYHIIVLNWHSTHFPSSSLSSYSSVNLVDEVWAAMLKMSIGKYLFMIDVFAEQVGVVDGNKVL